MGVFEYLGVILSVIMGLGVTHILAGFSKTIHQRKTVKPYWVQALWALNVLIYIVTIWWGMFWWSGQQEWSYFQFLLLITYAILLFLSASLIFPWDISDDFDLQRVVTGTCTPVDAARCAIGNLKFIGNEYIFTVAAFHSNPDRPAQKLLAVGFDARRKQ